MQPVPEQGEKSMRSNRLWIGVTCGVALALGGVAAVEVGTQTAGAAVQCPKPPPTSSDPNFPNCPPAVVQKVKPSPARADRKDSNPFTVSIRQHWIDQKIAAAAKRASNRALSKQLWASLEGTTSSGKVTILRQSWRPKSGYAGPFEATYNAKGDYTVDFKRNVSACSWTATALGPAPKAVTTAPGMDTGGDLDSSMVNVTVDVFSTTTQAPPADVDGRVDVQVLC